MCESILGCVKVVSCKLPKKLYFGQICVRNVFCANMCVAIYDGKPVLKHRFTTKSSRFRLERAYMRVRACGGV